MVIKLTKGCVFNPVFAFQMRNGWWRLQDKNGDHITVSSDEIKTLAAEIRTTESDPAPLAPDRACARDSNDESSTRAAGEHDG